VELNRPFVYFHRAAVIAFCEVCVPLSVRQKGTLVIEGLLIPVQIERLFQFVIRFGVAPELPIGQGKVSVEDRVVRRRGDGAAIFSGGLLVILIEVAQIAESIMVGGLVAISYELQNLSIKPDRRFFVGMLFTVVVGE